MRKKYVSALLFGALLFASAGTFTSCKDYDDDINNLQSQIDSQKALSEKLAAVESSIAGLQTADTELQKKIDEAKDAAEKAALEAQQNAVKEAAEQLAAVKSELSAMIENQAAQTEEAIKAVNEEIAKLQGSVQAIEKLNSDIQALQLADAQLQASLSDLDAKVQANANKIGELETALKTQADALEAYKTSNGADVTAIQNDIKALQDKIAEITGSEDLTSLTEQIETLKDEVKDLSTQVAAINSKLDVLYAAWYEGVTSVSLVVTDESPVQTVNLLSAKSLTTRTFGEGLDGAVEFVKGDRTKLKQEVVVRVSPVTATLDASSIKFVNSLGEESLNDLVEVTSVKPYDKVLSRGVNSASGLWVVELQAKGNDAKFETAFDEATLTAKTTEDEWGNVANNSQIKQESVLFAMKVVDDNSNTESARGVVSEYAITFGKKDAEAASKIDYDVFVGTNKFNVKELHNRFVSSEEDGTKTPTEYTWLAGAQIEEIFEGALTNTQQDATDNRQSKCVSAPAVPAFVKDPVVESKGESFKVRINTEGITHYYITLDKERAVTSDDSERKTWEELWESKITGINKVYSVNETPEAVIGFTSSDINDVLGFRVYAINANGTLADPDGRAFYVRVGKVANVATASTSIIPDENVNTKSEEVSFENLTQFIGNESQISSCDAITDQVFVAGEAHTRYVFDFKFAIEGEKDYKDLTYFAGKKVEDLAKIKSIYVTKNSQFDWTNFVDDQKYNTAISFYDSKRTVIATLNVGVVKTMPTSLPADFGWKEAQLTGDTFNCFLLPGDISNPVVMRQAWGAGKANVAYMDVNQIFNYDSDCSDRDEYKFTFRCGENIQDKSATFTSKLQLVKDEFAMIDGKTKYAAVIEYNYGQISSQHPTQDVKVTNLTAAEPKAYNLVYHDMFAAEHYAVNWATNENLVDETIYGTSNKYYTKVSIADQANQIKYGKDFSEFEAWSTPKLEGISDNNLQLLDAIVAISGLDSKFNKYLGYNNDNYVIATKAEFITNATGQESEYFKAQLTGKILKLTSIKKDSPVREAVPSTLKVTLLDSFGVERVVELPMTVVPNL